MAPPSSSVAPAQRTARHTAGCEYPAETPATRPPLGASTWIAAKIAAVARFATNTSSRSGSPPRCSSASDRSKSQCKAGASSSSSGSPSAPASIDRTSPVKSCSDPSACRAATTRHASCSFAKSSSVPRRIVPRLYGRSDKPLLEVCGEERERERDHEEHEGDEGEDLERVDLAEPDRRDRREPLVRAFARLERLEPPDHLRERRVLHDVHDEAHVRRQ